MTFYAFKKHILLKKETFSLIEKSTNTFGFYSAPDTTNFSGVAIFMGRGLHGFQIKNNNIDNPTLKYRTMHISIHADTIFHIINVYAPAKKQFQIPFYEAFYKYIFKYKNQNLIILVDFNFTEHEEDRLLGLQWHDKNYLKFAIFKI